jgi:hypothetical protein
MLDATSAPDTVAAKPSWRIKPALMYFRDHPPPHFHAGKQHFLLAPLGVR